MLNAWCKDVGILKFDDAAPALGWSSEQATLAALSWQMPPGTLTVPAAHQTLSWLQTRVIAVAVQLSAAGG